MLASQGAKVVIGDLSERSPAGNFDAEPSLTTAEAVKKQGGDVVFFACDVTRAAQVGRLIATARETYGRLDVLINNAGVYRGDLRMHEMSEADLDAGWNVSAKGSWLASQEALKVFLEQGWGGSIINIVSTAGLRGHLRQSPYNMAKAAQANLTRCLALEYAADGVRTNGICPTYMKTSMSRSGFDSPEFDRLVSQMIPLGRWGEISDVASLAAFLASDVARFLNGALISVDGGETAGAPSLATDTRS